MSVRTVAETMPPTMGTAIRRMTSEPVPVPHMIGSRPAMIATTVISFGRTRSAEHRYARLSDDEYHVVEPKTGVRERCPLDLAE